MLRRSAGFPFALTAVYTDPYDLSAHKLLAEVYDKAGNESGAARENRVIPVLEKWIEESNDQGRIPEPLRR